MAMGVGGARDDAASSAAKYKDILVSSKPPSCCPAVLRRRCKCVSSRDILVDAYVHPRYPSPQTIA